MSPRTRTTGLFLWCNWSIRENKRRACCSACVSSIMHNRCTDRILLVKHNTCKLAVASLVLGRLVRGHCVNIIVNISLRRLLGLLRSFFTQGCCAPNRVMLKTELWGQGHEMVRWMSCWSVTMAKTHKKRFLKLTLCMILLKNESYHYGRSKNKKTELLFNTFLVFDLRVAHNLWIFL